MKLNESAITRIKDLIMEEQNPNLKLRIFVQGGGCSGMQYGFTFDEESSDDDFNFVFEEVSVVVDPMSMDYLRDAEIIYKDDGFSSSFVIENPQAQTTCGCGSSFSPY